MAIDLFYSPRKGFEVEIVPCWVSFSESVKGKVELENFSDPFQLGYSNILQCETGKMS